MAEPVAPESVPYTQEFTVDADYQRSLTRALYFLQFRSAAVWILIGAFLLFLGLSIPGRLTGFVPVWLLLIALVFGLRYFRLRRFVRASLPVGKVMRSGFTATHFAISDGDNAGVVAYSGFDSIEQGNDVVWLRRKSPRRRVAYPRALFPPAEVEHIRASITSAEVPAG